jgi:hypothetical protein
MSSERPRRVRGSSRPTCWPPASLGAHLGRGGHEHSAGFWGDDRADVAARPAPRRRLGRELALERQQGRADVGVGGDLAGGLAGFGGADGFGVDGRGVEGAGGFGRGVGSAGSAAAWSTARATAR